jgi:hypothetical protein
LTQIQSSIRHPVCLFATSPPTPPPNQGSTFLGAGTSHGLSRLRRATHSNPGAGTHPEERSPHLLQKLESLASAAVRAASMIGADLIVVYTSTGGWSGRESMAEDIIVCYLVRLPVLCCGLGAAGTAHMP